MKKNNTSQEKQSENVVKSEQNARRTQNCAADCCTNSMIHDRRYMIDDCFQSEIENQQSKMILEAAE